ncbi:MAG TPA: VOC family protein [Gammaproteobacteria bacterium]|nr:VOC family protein [Gammaproteobacteria bacterium]
MTYGVRDLEKSRRFWTNFGLTQAKETAGEAEIVFEAQDGSSVMLRSADDPALPESAYRGETLREATFGVAAPEDLREIAAEIERDRPVLTAENGSVHFTDPAGFKVAFRVAQRRPTKAPELRFNTPGRPDRLNTRGQFFNEAKPLEMTHAVFMVSDSIEETVAFYTERLGFIVSDCYPGRGYFMRASASPHHHDLFLLNVGAKRGFHHVAFELGSMHELFGGGLNMTRHGWSTALGPGRHPISSCYFWYFHCPSGGAAEYDFDSDLVDHNWVPGSFEQTPERFAEWCLAEGMQESLLYKGVQRAETARSARESE